MIDFAVGPYPSWPTWATDVFLVSNRRAASRAPPRGDRARGEDKPRPHRKSASCTFRRGPKADAWVRQATWEGGTTGFPAPQAGRTDSVGGVQGSRNRTPPVARL